MQQPQGSPEAAEAYANASESMESKISIKEERAFARNNLLRQLAVPLALSADEIINKLMGRTIKGEGSAGSHGNDRKITAARAIANDVPANLDHKQFLHWHVQHQKVDPKMRVYAARDCVVASKITVPKLFLNLLRLERVVIRSNDGDPVFLAVIEERDPNAPSRMRRIVRGFRSRTEADKAYYGSHEKDNFEHGEGHDETDGDGCTLGELMDRRRPGWRLDNSLCDEMKIEMDRITRFIAGASFPRFKDAVTIATALGVSTNMVQSACRKSRSDAGLAGKKLLATWRESRGFSVQDLATRSGVCVLSIKKYERGFYPRLTQTRKALVKALNVGIRNVMWGSTDLDNADSELGHQE